MTTHITHADSDEFGQPIAVAAANLDTDAIADETDDAADAMADHHDLTEQLHATKPWYFTNGRRQPYEARRSQRSGRRLAKLMPEEDRWSDRITNQLMFVPPNYEEYRASGQMKTIVLYNGLGPWGKVNEGEFERTFFFDWESLCAGY